MKLIKTEEVRFFAEHLINRKDVSLFGKTEDKVIVSGVFVFPKPSKKRWDDMNVSDVMTLIQSHEVLMLMCEEFNFNLKEHYKRSSREVNDVFADHEQIAILHGAKRKPEYPLMPKIPKDVEDHTGIYYTNKPVGNLTQVTMTFNKTFKFRFNLFTGMIDEETLRTTIDGYALLLRRAYLIQDYNKKH